MGQVEYWLMGQIVLEFLLIIGIGFMFYQVKRLQRGRSDPKEIQRILSETNLLKDDLLETLQTRKAIITNLIKQLDQKVATAQNALRMLEHQGELVMAANSGSEAYHFPAAGMALRERVERLQSQGLSVDQIASHLKISKGEVMLVLDLRRAEAK